MHLIDEEKKRAVASVRAGRTRRDGPLRVAFVLHAMQVAGAEVLVLETIRKLAGQIEPTVICLDNVGPLGEQLRLEGIEVACLERRPGRDPRAVWRMASILRRRNIEVVHAHQYTPFFYATLGASVSRIHPRVIFTEHGRHYPDVVSPLRRAANKMLFSRMASAVNAVSGFSAESLRWVDGFAARSIEVVENGIEIERYEMHRDRRALRERFGLDLDRTYIPNVARLHPIKDQAMLLRGFAEVAATRRDVDLLLIGDGALRGPLERLAEDLRVADRVKFLGVRSDVAELLAAVDIFALTSICEAASLTLLEAMASALPVVATAVGGTPEIVRDGIDGILVPRGDAHATASAFLRLLDDPVAASGMGASARERVRCRYQLSRTIENYLAIYVKLSGWRG